MRNQQTGWFAQIMLPLLALIAREGQSDDL